VAPSIPGDEIQTVQEQRSSSRTTLIAEWITGKNGRELVNGNERPKWSVYRVTIL
jgi:hypothetical protein